MAGLVFAAGQQHGGQALALEGGDLRFASPAAKSPVMCTKPKRGMERKRGVVDINDANTFDKAECDLGGYTTKTPYTLNTPDSFRPFTGYFKGGPDSSGLLDLRLQSQGYGSEPVTIFVRSYRYKPDGSLMDKKNAPWVDKASITDLGNPEAFLKVLAANLAVDETVASSETVDGVTYYRYQLFKNEKGYANNRKIISAAVVDGDLLTAVGLASEPSWEAVKPDLLKAVNSFRVMPAAPPASNPPSN